MHPAAAERIEIDRKRRHQRLAFAGLHLRDAALVQDHAADELNVEVPLPQVRFAASRQVAKAGTRISSRLAPSVH